MLNMNKFLKNKIKESCGGLYNCHAHLDRAFTLTEENFHLTQKDLKEKWKLIDKIKKNSSEKDIFNRMSFILSKQIAQGVKSIITFIDFDDIIKNKSYEALELAKKQYPQIKIKSVNQTMKGVVSKKARYWFDVGAEKSDIIGSLPAKDKDNIEKHLDIVFRKAKDLNKEIHIHVDQFNTCKEKETELVLNKIDDYGLNGKITLIHCISLACHPEDYRKNIYEKIKKTNTKIICCPSAWMDSPRKEELQPSHNPVTPVDEMLKYGIIVGVGTDNISDLMCPFIDGNMMTELKNLALLCRIYDENKLLKIIENSKIICGC